MVLAIATAVIYWLATNSKPKYHAQPIRRKYEYDHKPHQEPRIVGREVPSEPKKRPILFPDGMKSHAVAQSQKSLKRSVSDPRTKQFVTRLTPEQSDKVARRVTEVEVQRL